MPAIPKPNVPNKKGGGQLQVAAQTAQEQLANQPLEMAPPTRIVINGNDHGIAPGSIGPVEDPFNQRGGQPEQLPPPAGWDAQAEDLSQLPNWDKLSGSERAITLAMPGISGTLADAYKAWDASWYGAPTSALAAASPFLKWGADVLAAIDLLAETNERATGTIAQTVEATGFGARGNFLLGDGKLDPNFTNNLMAAWYAGALTADAADITVQIDKNGISVPRDLGGLPVVIKARQRIAELVSQGTTYHDALVMAREEYYSSLGALAIRAQAQDLLFHIAADPLNIITGAIKPFEYTRALRGKVLGLSATPEALKALGTAADVARAELKTAQAAGDIAKITAAEGVLEAAEASLLAAKRTSLSWAEQRLLTVAGLGDEQRGARNIVQLTGGGLDAPVPNPAALELGRLASGKTNWKALARTFNPFALSPQARAQEYLTIFRDFVGTHLLAANRLADGSYDVDGFVRGLQRVIDGVHAPEMGNMVLSVEGRTVRAAAAGFGPKLNELYAARQLSQKFETPLLMLMSEALETTPHDIIRRLNKGEVPAVLAQITERLGALPEAQVAVRKLLAANNLADLTPDVLQRLSHVLGGKEFAGYTDDLFIAEVQNALIDHVERQAILQFGIKNRGILRNMAELVKSAESLIYLRINPGYPVRNWINNNITLIARGAFGTKLDVSAATFLKTHGFLPPRFGEGAGVEGFDAAAQATGAAVRTPGQLIRDTEKGAGLLNAVADKIKGIKLPAAVDMSAWAAKGETTASARAFTTFYERHIGPIKRALMGNPAELAPEAFRGVSRGVVEDIRNAFVSVNTEAEIDALFQTANIKANFESIAARAQRASGIKLDQALAWEEVRPLGEALAAAARTGDRAAVDKAVTEFGTAVQTHIDELLENSIGTLRDEAAARVSAEGPAAFGKLWADSMDEWWAAHERHALDIQQAVDLIKRNKPDLAHALWQESRDTARQYWGRQFDRLEQRVGGFAEKATELGLPGVPELTAQLKEWRTGWEAFFLTRDNLWDGYWAARRVGDVPPVSYEAIVKQLDDGYRAMVTNEIRYQRAIDGRMAQMLPEEQRPLFEAWRNRVNEYRAADKESVVAFRQRVRTLPPSQVEAAYRAHWKDRIKAWNQLRQEERAGLAAMLGSSPAQQHFAESTARVRADYAMFDALWPKLSDGQPLTIDEAMELDSFLRKYATPEEAAQLAKLDGEEMAAQLNPPMVPTVQGAQSLEDQIRRAAAMANNELTPLMEALDSKTVRKYFNVTGEGITGKTVWRNTETGAWRPWTVKPPADGGKWVKTPGDEVDGWVEMVYEQIMGGLPNTADTNPADLWRQLEDAYAARKANYTASRRPAVTDIPMELDAETLAVEQANRQSERLFIQAEIAERLRPVAEQGAPPPVELPTLPDIEAIIKPELYMGTGLDQHWYTRGQDALRALKTATLDIMDEPPSRWADLPQQAQVALREYAAQAKGALKDARYHATRMGEWGRDSALLNYNRKFNYNVWFGTFIPFEFWGSQSAWKWAMHSIDRPGMAAAYLRIKKFLETAYRPEEGLPSRLKGSIRIPIPFMPDWMGNEVFFDPLQISVPFDNWLAPFEQMNAQEVADLGAADRKLEELYNDREIGYEEYLEAAQHRGPTWARALALARQDDTEGRMNGWDVATALFPPHLPILYAMDAARGRNPFEERGPILPMTRSLGNILAVLGADPAGLNPEAALRKGLGLHPFSKWDDYLAERMLSNMVATGATSLDDAKGAMIEHTGPAWDEALRRVGIERTGGNVITAAMGLAGIPLKGYPPGEEANRKLKDDYAAAWERYEASGGDYDATVGKWLEEHPGYEARLALFQKPEVRLQQFLTDQFWHIWRGLPQLTQDQLQEQLGQEFSDAMFDQATGWGRNADPAKLATWLKLMGGSPAGTLQAAPGVTVDLAPSEIAQRAEVFYTTRNAQYPDWRTAQNGYYDLLDALAGQYGVEAALVELQKAGDDKAARASVYRQYPALSAYTTAKKQATAQYLADHPALKPYWDWRDSFLARNTDVAPYLDDDPVYAERAPSPAYLPEPDFTWQEWRNQLGFELPNLIVDFVDYNEPLPEVAIKRLEEQMAKMGWTGDLYSFVEHIAESRDTDYGYIAP